MPFPISCQLCQAAFAIDEELFERRVAGRAVRFKCPVCKGHSLIDSARKGALDTSAGKSLRRLAESDLVVDEADVAELSDDEVASLPPESMAAAKAARPKPKPRLESKVDDELWVVSVKEGVEDQEIFESSLIDLIATGKMPPDAIVWREGIDNWIPLADVPELAKHLPPPDDRTGGFLGTGMQLSFGSNAGERKSAPPPLPPKKRSYGNAKKKSYGGEGRAKPVALSPGFLFSVDDAESEPPQPIEEPKKGGKAVPKPPLKAPKRAVTRDLDFSDIAEEEVIPSSGAPALRDLTLAIKAPEPSPPPPVALFGELGGAEDEVLGPPSIDISDLGSPMGAVEQPPAEPKLPAEAAPSSPPASKKGSKGKSKRPPAAARSEAPAPSKRASAARTRAAEDEAIVPGLPEQRGWFTPGRILVLLGIAALAYFLFSRQMQPAPTTTVPPPPSVARQEPPEPAPVETSAPSPTPAEPEPSAPAEPAASVSAAAGEPAVPPRPSPGTGAGEKPMARGVTSEPAPPAVTEQAPKPEIKAEPKPEPKPEPMPANPDAPPFNKDAAVAALNTAVAQASGCRQDGDPSGTARVVVTFAPSGRVTSANLNGPPFAGTRTGGCIASTMRRAKIPPFSGSHVTVAKSVVIR